MTTLLNIIAWCTLIVLTIVALALVVAAVIAVTYKAKEGVGPYQQSAIVKTSDPGNPQIKFTVKGEIVASATVTPAS